MSTTSSLIQGIDTIIIRVSHAANAKKWYTETLGFNVLFEDESMGLVVLDTGGPTSLTLWKTDQPIKGNSKTSAYPIFKTKDAEALRNELEKKDVKVDAIEQDEYVKFFHFYDPDGNMLEACQLLQ